MYLHKSILSCLSFTFVARRYNDKDKEKLIDFYICFNEYTRNRNCHLKFS